MKPGDETPQNWQQPTENLSQAPYQAPAPQPVVPQVPTTPVPTVPQPAPLAPVTPAPQLPQQPQPSTIETDVAVNPDESTSHEQQFATEDGEADDPSLDMTPSDDDTALLRWQATEYIHHERTGLWYAVLGLVVVAFILLAIFVFNSVTFAILIPVMLVALVVYVRRPPSILSYTLSRKGLHVNDHLYTYDQFKAFGVVTHEDVHSVVLLPRKRFQVSQTVYFPEEVGESLVDMIAARLPMQEVQLDAVDKLLKKLRI